MWRVLIRFGTYNIHNGRNGGLELELNSKGWYRSVRSIGEGENKRYAKKEENSPEGKEREYEY